MKPFGVLAVNAVDQMWDFHVNLNATRIRRNPHEWLDEDAPLVVDNGIQVYVDGKQPEVSENEAGEFDAGQIVYYTNTAEEAQRLAEFLARRNPQNKYMTFNTNHVYHAPPGEVQRAAFNEKGLLPS